MVVRYFLELLDVFVKWWWAAITGVASILSWLAVPEAGLTIGRFSAAILIFGVLTTAFLLLSIIVRSFRWYVDRARPEVVRFSTVPGAACTFVVRSPGEPVHAGYLLTVFRRLKDEEVAIAVLRVDQGDLPEGNVQCSSIWISPGHRREMASGAVQPRDLLIRRALPENLLQQIRTTP